MTYDQLIGELTTVPEIRGIVPETRRLVIGGMGASGLAGDALGFFEGARSVSVHKDYGFPGAADDTLYVAVSYSGNTEETLSFAKAVRDKDLPLAVVASGGVLLQFAREHDLPYALVTPGIAPRNAFLYLTLGLLTLVGEKELLADIARAQPEEKALMEAAEQDAHFLVQGVPLFYSSNRNKFLGLLGALIMDESARTPSFHNTFPELNHNEMQAFDRDMPEGLEHLFRMFLIRDENDDHRILKRMHVFEKLLKERGRTLRTIDLSSMTRAEAFVTLWMRFLFTARLLAETRGIDPDTQPLTDEFKTLL